MFFLKHPDNGVKISFFDSEVKADEAEGWVKFDPWVKIVEDIAAIAPSTTTGVVDAVSDVVDQLVEVIDKRTKKYKDSVAVAAPVPDIAPVPEIVAEPIPDIFG